MVPDRFLASLGAVETTLVIERGVTIGRALLKDHLEALDHFDAIGYVEERTPETDSRGDLPTQEGAP
jgi:hypothetical protein